MTDDQVYSYVMLLGSLAIVVRPDPILAVPIRDPNDIAVIQTAVAGGADVICTIDNDFFQSSSAEFLKRANIAVAIGLFVLAVAELPQWRDVRWTERKVQVFHSLRLAFQLPDVRGRLDCDLASVFEMENHNFLIRTARAHLPIAEFDLLDSLAIDLAKAPARWRVGRTASADARASQERAVTPSLVTRKFRRASRPW